MGNDPCLRFTRDLPSFSFESPSGQTQPGTNAHLAPFVPRVAGSDPLVTADTMLIQAPVISDGGVLDLQEQLTGYFDNQFVGWEDKHRAFLNHMTLDFFWNPSAQGDFFSNNYIFICKVKNIAQSVEEGTTVPGPPLALSAGQASWILDIRGNIDCTKLKEGIHYLLGAGGQANVTLNPVYFETIKKYNLCCNKRSLGSGVLPANGVLNWKCSLPLGNLEIKPYMPASTGALGSALPGGDAPGGGDVPLWINVRKSDIEIHKQYHSTS